MWQIQTVLQPGLKHQGKLFIIISAAVFYQIKSQIQSCLEHINHGCFMLYSDQTNYPFICLVGEKINVWLFLYRDDKLFPVGGRSWKSDAGIRFENFVKANDLDSDVTGF